MRPRLTASSTSKAPTTVPAAETSHLRRPADISSIILPSSTAETCSRFVAGQALWTFQTKRGWAAAVRGPCQRTAARIRTGSAKAIQMSISRRVGLMACPLSGYTLLLAEKPARQPERNLRKRDAQRQPDQLEHHELEHAVVDVTHVPARRHALEVVRRHRHRRRKEGRLQIHGDQR